MRAAARAVRHTKQRRQVSTAIIGQGGEGAWALYLAAVLIGDVAQEDGAANLSDAIDGLQPPDTLSTGAEMLCVVGKDSAHPTHCHVVDEDDRLSEPQDGMGSVTIGGGLSGDRSSLPRGEIKGRSGRGFAGRRSLTRRRA